MTDTVVFKFLKTSKLAQVGELEVEVSDINNAELTRQQIQQHLEEGTYKRYLVLDQEEADVEFQYSYNGPQPFIPAGALIRNVEPANDNDAS